MRHDGASSHGQRRDDHPSACAYLTFTFHSENNKGYKQAHVHDTFSFTLKNEPQFKMLPTSLFLSSLLLPFTVAQSTQYTNLPPPSFPGLFSASTRILIHNTSTSAAYAALSNFPLYSTWNPFVRSAIVVSPLNITLQQQTPIEGANLFLRTQIPPLPFPVDEHTPDNPLATQFAYELITHVQPELGRLCWKYAVVDAVVRAERWQAVSDMGGGTVLYESREVFDGLAAGVVKAGFGEDLQKGFDAQGAGLKRLLEGST
jgi:hypothetical protein